ncbi:MAG: hypothetical protein BECKG1743D_GA0114223_108172 [Candidatus Kentron sp. G]|nr:MAG: hypothetical protein BECKG1743E_GA0114224_108372 [Candidatus Kentron sp. G]VFN06130.1 MAG: hypothetical protein BECKG1743D_GA0114223_108172 [Candidatus Kentron sp. G]
MSNLPVEFNTEPLGSIASIRRGITYSASMLVEKGNGIPYVNMKSFQKGGGFNWDGLKYYRGLFKKDDLVGKSDLLVVNTDVTPDGDIVGTAAALPSGGCNPSSATPFGSIG